MALADGVFVDTIVQALKNLIALDVTGGSPKVAMFTDTLVPDFSQVAPAYGSSPWNANEVTGGSGYTTGGLAVTVTFSELGSQPGTSMLDITTNPAWTTATITNARGFLLYYSGLSNRGLLVRTFGADYSSIAGTFTINIHANGCWNNDLS